MTEKVYVTRLPRFYDMKYVTKEGRLTPDAYLFNDHAYSVLGNVANQFIEGLRSPQLSDAQITAQGSNNNVPDGTIWYDETNDLMKVKVAGLVKTFTVT